MADSLAAALAELQANPPRIGKKARAQYGNYADLPAVTKALMPRLSELGLLWQTWPTISAGNFVLCWSLRHVASGEELGGEYPIHAADPQRAGSEITYARRYALVTVTGVTPEGDDDDGQAASRTRAKTTGAEHERLRHGTVEPTPDDRPAERVRPGDNPPVDMWMDSGTPESDAPPEDRPGSIDPRGADMRRIQSLFSKLGIDDRSVRLGMTSDLIGREILSAAQLSVAEGKFLIRKLNDRLEATP